jgi:hypothetical protein
MFLQHHHHQQHHSPQKGAHFRFMLAPSRLEGIPASFQRVKLVVSHSNGHWYAASSASDVHARAGSGGGEASFQELSFTCHVPEASSKVCFSVCVYV